MASKQEADEQAKHFHQCNYNCGQTSDRYLMSKSPGVESAAAGAGAGSGAATDTNNNNRSSPAKEEHEMLHVLVSRPEIAARPRDNIVFEGDMDLRTTFETSYEALAKMRLDTWRRHQELQARGGSQTDKTGTGGQPGRPRDEQRRALDVSVEDEPAGGGGGQANLARGRQEAVGRPKRELGGAQAGEQAEQTSGDSNDVSRVGGTGKMNSPLPPSPAVSPVPAARPLRPKPTQQRGAARHHRQQQQPRSDLAKEATNNNSSDVQYIDPDLSPIIVYDANMNRLERVGVRKRSKYRPSTSLRSGARGLFGDQAEAAAKRDEAVQVGGPGDELEAGGEQRDTNAARPAQTAAGLSSRGKLSSGGTHCDVCTLTDLVVYFSNTGAHYKGQGSPTVAPTPDMAALEARQALGLTYTDRNLPVDTKRKNLDNINLVDHLREQSRDLQLIEDKNRAATSTPTEVAVAAKGEHPLAGPESQQDRLLSAREEAEQDEAAAVEEIQRCTLKSPTPPPGADQPAGRSSTRATSTRLAKRSTTPGGRASSTGETGSVAGSRQGKLQRTCQNQSFYLYENEYPEPKSEISYYKLTPIDGELELGGDGRAYGQTNTPVEGQRRRLIVAKRNNLFRESPDSTLNFGGRQTGKQHSKDKQRPRRDTKEASGRGRETRTTGRISTMDENNVDHYNQQKLPSSTTSTPTGQLVANGTSPGGAGKQHTCKVLLLDRDFDFVGHHSGHHYFVEKQLNANEIYEREAAI